MMALISWGMKSVKYSSSRKYTAILDVSRLAVKMNVHCSNVKMPVRPQSVAGKHLRSIQNGPGVYLADLDRFGQIWVSFTRKNEDAQGM